MSSHHHQDASALTVASGHTIVGSHVMHQAKRSDTLIASTVLVLLIAGWVMNFVSIKQLSQSFDNLIAYTVSRHA